MAAVVWDINNQLDGTSSTHTSKLRVYQRDVLSNISPGKSSGNGGSSGDREILLKGIDLRLLLVKELEKNVLPLDDLLLLDPATTLIEVNVYDTTKSAYASLEALLEEDILQQLGSRLRIHVRVSANDNNNTTGDTTTNDKIQPKAIMGRFYSYNALEGLTIAGEKLRVQEIPNQQNTGTGVNVWDGALLLAQYLEKQPALVKSKRIVELGAGCGLVGIAAGILGAKDVLVTDLPYTLANMQANVDQHAHLWTNAGCQQLKCHTCDWFHPPTLHELAVVMSPPSSSSAGESSITNPDWRPDVILIADCVWMHELVAPLLATVEQWTKIRRSNWDTTQQSTKVIISYQRRGKDTHEAFMAGLHSKFGGTHIVEMDVSAVGLSKPDSIVLLSMDIPY